MRKGVVVLDGGSWMQLTPLYEARSVALVGASRSEVSVSGAVMRNILEGGYKGEVYPVNPKADRVMGLKAYPSVSKIPADVDMAVIMVPAQRVPEVMEDCVDAGVRAGVLISAGFSETRREEGRKLGEDVLRAARRGRLRFTGGNCNGVCSVSTSLHALLSPVRPRLGDVAFVSQGGSLGVVTMGLTWKYGVGLSRYTNLGDEMDVKVHEVMEYYINDPRTRVVAAYLESVRDGRMLMETARRGVLKKPIVVYKSGVTEAGRRAAEAHVGALAGSDEVFNAVTKQTGMVRARTVEQLMGIAAAFSTQPLPKGRKVGIVTVGGGWGVVVADALGVGGGELVELTEEEVEYLNRFLPPHWSRQNPVDTTDGAFDPEVLVKCTEILIRKEEVDGVIVVGVGIIEAFVNLMVKDEDLRELGVQSEVNIAERIVKLRDRYQKPVLAATIYAERDSRVVEALKEMGMPVYDSPHTVASAFLAMAEYHDHVERIKRPYKPL